MSVTLATPTTKSGAARAVVHPLWVRMTHWINAIAMIVMIMIFSTADILNIVMRTWLFPKADKAYYYAPIICEPTPATTTPDNRGPKEGCVTADQAKRDEEMRVAQKQRDLVRDVSMLLVAAPVFAFHWRIIRKREQD